MTRGSWWRWAGAASGPTRAEMTARIDHVVLMVRDLDSAAVAADDLGFSVTPQGRHPHFGTANHLLVLDRAYLELLTVVEPRAENAMYRRRCEEQPGIFALAMATANVAHERARLEALGFKSPAPVEFGREVRIGATVADARFRVLLPGMNISEHVLFFYCEHLTPALVWRSEWQQHANGAVHLARVTVAASNLHRVATRYARLLGAALESVDGDHALIVLDHQAISLISPAGVHRRLGIETADLLDPQ